MTYSKLGVIAARSFIAIIAATGTTTIFAAPEPKDADKEAEAIAELTRPASVIEVGAGIVSDGSFAAGNINGLDRKGGYSIANIDLRGSQYRFGNSGDDRTRWRVTGSNLGLDSRSLAGEYGRQGNYRFLFSYDEIPRLISDNYQTPFLGAGTSMLTLPTGFVRGADTSAMSTLAASMQNVDIDVKRKRSEIAMSYWLTREWELRASWRNDDRDGIVIRGAEFGSNGGNPRTMLLPEPVDSSTQLVDLSVAFAGESHRFTLAYHGSFFRNHVDALGWQNPYSSAPWVGGASGLAADFPLLRGQIGVDPDNQFHQVSANGSIEFSSTTRLTVAGARGRMTQNEAFLPYTITPGLATSALLRASLNGIVDTTFLYARLTARPVRNLSINATLRFNDRDNKTPMSEYIYIGGDIQLQPQPASNSDRIRTNLPRSRRQEQATLDADYRVAPGALIKAGWDFDAIKRTFAEVERTTENTYRLDFRHGSTGPWTATAGVALLVRRGSQYIHNLSYLASYTSPAYIAALIAANGCTSPIDCVRLGPLQNKFYLADRDRERSRVSIGFTPNEAVWVQARLDANRDRYPRSPFGLTSTNSWTASADLGFVATENLTATLFYTVEQQRNRERTRQIINANTPIPASSNADWVNQMTDNSASIGVGFKYKGLLGGKMELQADAIAVRGRIDVSTTVGSAVVAAQNPASPFPDLTARSENLNFDARYALDRQSTVRLNYLYRRLNSADWAYQHVGVATISNAIGTNEVPAHFRVHGAGLSYIRTFR